MEQKIDLLLRYLRAAWRRRWLGLAVAWAVCLAGWGYIQTRPDEYQSHARLYVDADAVLTPLLHGLAVDVSSADQLAVLQRTLLSRPNLQMLVAKTDLGLQAPTAADRERLIDSLSKRIKVDAQDRNLFAIEFKDTNPRLARDVVQTLLSLFTESATGSNRREMENAQQFLQRQIASYEKQLHAMEERRAKFRAEYAGLIPLDGNPGNGVETARAEVARLTLALEDEQGKQQRLKESLQKAPQNLAGAALPAAGGGQPALAQAEAHLREMQTMFTDDYPGVIEQKKLIEQLRKSPNPGAGGPAGRAGIPNELYSQLTVKLLDVEASIASLERQLQVAKDNLARLEKIRQDQPGLLAQYENMDRDYGVLRHNYDELLARLQSATISQAADTQADKVHLRVVDPPEVPLVPVAPNRPLLLSGVLVAGIGMGAGVAVLLALLDRTFASIEELRGFGLPVLGGLSVIGGVSRRRRALPAMRFAVALILLVGLYGGLIAHLVAKSV
jgi:polysaccharide chain length determinant protein (PEP-CTERM system associated)